MPKTFDYKQAQEQIVFFKKLMFALKRGASFGKTHLDELQQQINCTYKNKSVTRTKEGLFCHHIDEDKAIRLSNDKFAVKNPFEYQKAERLVYCNFLEHLLLHILIVEKHKKGSENEGERQGIGGAVNCICRQLNDFYEGAEYKQEWMRNVTSIVKNDYYSYILMLQRLWNDIKNDSILSMLISKEDMAKGWEDNIYPRILKELE